MSITKESELSGMQEISTVVGTILRKMREYTEPGMSTGELDQYASKLFKKYKAKSAPFETYGFPGFTCISVNNEAAHGIPNNQKILKEGDLINIDVSAELNGFWADNGGSFILGDDKQGLQPLVEASKIILKKAINQCIGGARIADVGDTMESQAKQLGFKVIKNLAGHGVGRSLHEKPDNILNYKVHSNWSRFNNNTTVAIETFISTHSSLVRETGDGWTLVGTKGGFVAQHEHTIMIRDKQALVMTECNGIWE